MPLVIIYRRICDGCGGTQSPNSPDVGMSEADANAYALMAGFKHFFGYWFCPKCQENLEGYLSKGVEKIKHREKKIRQYTSLYGGLVSGPYDY